MSDSYLALRKNARVVKTRVTGDALEFILYKGENGLTFSQNHENLKGATFGSFALRPLREK